MSEYPVNQTALLHVDPYNDFISEGGKLYDICKETIESTGLLGHTRQLIAACEAAGIVQIGRAHV